MSDWPQIPWSNWIAPPSHTKIQCSGATGRAIRNTVTCKLALIFSGLWLLSKLGPICYSDPAAFIGMSGNTFSRVLSQSGETG